MFAVSVHSLDRRPREGGEVEAELASRCVTDPWFPAHSSHLQPGLSIVEVDKAAPKKKGRTSRVVEDSDDDEEESK